MVQFINGNYSIDYLDFMNLINNGGWKLNKSMKDNWTANRHVDYISNIISTKANLLVQFVRDNNSLNSATRIDVYITSDVQDADSSSKPKYIQFIKTDL